MANSATSSTSADSPATYTHPSVLAGIATGASWADPTMDPAEIDWTARQAAALLPFAVVNGRPVNPCERTGIRYGRNAFGHWGEQAMADALVVATDQREHRWIAMVERADGLGWALPGGYVDPGESATAAAVRELAEETGLVLPNAVWETSAPRYVFDARASDEAWPVTVLARTYLGVFEHRYRFPAVVGSDDARQAAWVRADSYDDLTRHLSEVFAGHVFGAHRALLGDVLG